MKFLAILQARMRSSRLSGKVLMKLAGKPMLHHQILRVQRVDMLDELIVATSISHADDSIAELCKDLGVKCYRGSQDDVLDRFYQAAISFNPKNIVRLTGDCPLFDPAVCKRVLKMHLAEQADYTSNRLNPTYPDGLDIEVMTCRALTRAWQEAGLCSEREHVTPYIYKNPGLFKLVSVENDEDLSSLRWTVDEPEDLQLIRCIYSALYETKPDFGFDDILAFLDSNRELISMNQQYRRDEGYAKSLLKDQSCT